eukprot:GFKZ01015753.1.p1 GENE.GFKZ01015753.1~~GFKZ01015753.1.p1  ORF type:complete len:401 (-),score=69.89 GFKZ01015753.1:264-1343(-)
MTLPYPNATLFLFFLPLVAALYLEQPDYSTVLNHLPSNPALLIFTVQWCDHSRALRPEIKRLASSATHSPLLVARIDADYDAALPAALSVSAYPTILFLPTGASLKPDDAFEFADYRWAEVIAEFVNNQTELEHLVVKPEGKYLRWRENHPFNLGLSGKKEVVQKVEKEFKPIPGIREPTRYREDFFEEVVLGSESIRFMILFYKQGDPLLEELMVQWRQASSAFTEADQLSVGVFEVSGEREEMLAERFNVTETPTCLYFGQCVEGEKLPKCKGPVKCNDDQSDTDEIIQFLSRKFMEEMGLEFGETRQGESYHLTEEEYQMMKAQGKVFANDPDQEDKIRSMYREREKEVAHHKDEL